MFVNKLFAAASRWFGRSARAASAAAATPAPAPRRHHPEPTLTIGIPTQGRRPERLRQAIASALAQSVPAVVLVADQGGGAEVPLREFAGHPLVRRVVTDAACLWDNWAAAAEAAETPLFAWLQDDDVVTPNFAARVTGGFDRFASASLWMARLGISEIPGLACWWKSTGPMFPMDLFHGGMAAIHGEMLTVCAYFTSCALSPGVAFRRTPEALAAVRRVPTDADLFAERSVLAELGRLGPAVIDPAIVGYWVQHEDNESKRQNADGTGEAQYRRMIEHLDPLLAAVPDWQARLAGWCQLLGPDVVKHHYKVTAPFADASPLLREARAVLEAFGKPVRVLGAEGEVQEGAAA